ALYLSSARSLPFVLAPPVGSRRGQQQHRASFHRLPFVLHVRCALYAQPSTSLSSLQLSGNASAPLLPVLRHAGLEIYACAFHGIVFLLCVPEGRALKE
ncbi:hypothetical protein INR49_032046, partial [Caranx melampygus]